MRGVNGNIPVVGFVFAVALTTPLHAQQTPSASDFAALGKPIENRVLDAKRGRQQTMVINSQETEARLHDNRAIDTVSGSNFIGDNAFSSSTGLPVAIQNSGNNVIIQNSFILNMDLK
ncbi:MAG: hypothetical protein KIS79_15745 [Burkholderiales bacterium]|nr:hypothetical protein [Burkholderiales bacterium]